MRGFGILLVILAFGQTAATAEEAKISGDAIRIMLNDMTFNQIKPTTKYKIEQIFQSSGVTHFIVNGDVQTGRWRVEKDQYCSNWPPTEHWDCYDILQSGETLIFLSAQGARYVMVPATR